MIRKCLSRRVTFILLASFILQLIPVLPADAQSATVTLSATTSPTSGQAGVHLVSVTGSGYPAGAIDPAAVTIRLAPAPPAIGPSAQTRASTLTTIVGTSRRATFLIPASLVVANPTTYQVTLDGISAAGVPFQSGNASLLFVNPPALIVSATPNAAFQGASTAVTLQTQYTNFVQGSTQAAFGPGIRVGGAAPGAFGPVTVLSATQAQAQITIEPAAALGPRTVQVKTGIQEASKAGAFSVIGPTVTALEPSQLTIAAGGSGSLTVRIQNADPSRATHIAIATGDSSVAGAPAEVVLPAGSTEGIVPIAGGTAGGPIQITASLNGSSASAEVTVRQLPPAPSLNEPLVEGALVVGGTGVANALVDVQVNAAAAGFGVVAGNGQFAVNVAALHAGEIVTATQTVGGLTGPASAPVTVRARPPAPTVNSPIFDGATIVAGSGVSNAAIDVFVNGAPVASGNADPSGAFSIVVPALATGQQVTATQTVAGVTSIPSAAVTVIAIPPAPSVTAPLVEGAASVSGNGVSGATVEVFVDNVSAGTAIVGGASSWSLLLGIALVAGQRVKARQTVAGIASDFSAELIVVARPPKPIIGSPLVEGGTAISGSGVVGASVRVFLDAVLAGTTTVGGGGAWTLTLAGPLVAGQAATADQTVGGIQSDLSAPVVVLARPPAPVVTAPLVEGSTSVTGTGVAGAALELFVGGAAAGTATVAAAGTWTVLLGAALVAGQSVQARQTVAAIVSNLSAPVIVLARPPAPTINAPIFAGALSVQGTGVVGASLEVFANGSSLGTTAVAPGGTWSLPLGAALVAGQVITARQTVAGVTGPLSAPVTVQAALTSIEIAPAPTATLNVGQTVQFSARGIFSDNSIQDPLAGVSWSSDAGAIVSIDNSGLATAQAAGVANIRASVGVISSVATGVTVKPLPPTVNSPINSGSTTVSGTGATPGASVQVFVNGVARGAAAAADGVGQWSAAGLSPSLAAGDSVTARQTVNGVQSDPSSAVIVLAGTPVLTSITVTPANLTVPRGTTQAYVATGSFSDGSSRNITAEVVWSSTNLPIASINTAGVASALDAGPTTIKATKDGVTGSTALTVTAPELVSIVVTPASPIVLTTASQAFLATGVLTDGTSQNLSGQVIWGSSDPGKATIDAVSGVATGVAAGPTTISATKGSVAGTTTLSVQTKVTDPTAPTAAITSPAANSTVTASVNIVGTATDANFSKYVLEYAPVGSATFTPIVTGIAPVSNGVLGVLDPTLLINDLYTVQLRVFDRGGNIASASRVFQVSRDVKVGNFTLTFQDLSVPMSGLPINVNRVYDSRDKRVGDFGVGWRLDIQTLRLRANRVQGSGWQVNRSGGPFGTYTLVGTDEHKISITLADGTVEEFDLTITPSSQAIVPLPQFLTASYTRRAATRGTLVPLDGTGIFMNGAQPGPVDLLDDSTFDFYDPQTFQYTTYEGMVFVINKTAGVQSAKDQNGNTLTFNAGGIIHSAGASVLFNRDGQGRITTLTAPDGKVSHYTYDGNGDLASYADPALDTTRYFYNLSHGVIEIRDPRGLRPLKNEYDDTGRLVAHIDAQGHRVEYSHIVGTRQEVVLDRNGGQTLYEYDAAGNVVRITDPLGKVTQYTFDARGNKLSETDPLGKTTSYTYDANNNRTSQTDALGRTTTRTFNARGQELTQTDPLGRVTQNTFNATGNLLTAKDAAGNTSTYTYDARGNQLTAADPLGNTITSVYDASGRQTRRTDQLGNAFTATYDNSGRRLSETSPRGGVTRFTYDSAGRETAVENPLGQISRTEYDSAGNKTATIDAVGNRTENVYDAANRLISTKFPDGTMVVNTYDADGNLVAVVDQVGRKTEITYDSKKQRIETKYPDGTTERYTYDDAGRQLTAKDQLGNIAESQYDAAGQEIKTIDAFGHVTTLSYDLAGNLLSRTDPNGHATQFVYDQLNRLTKVTLPGGQATNQAYDAAGRKLSETDAAGRVTQFAYDANGHVTAVTDALGGITRFEYDANGNRTAIVDARGNRTTFTFDLANRPTSTTSPNGALETHTYDGAGRVIAKRDPLGRTINYSYDGLSRLITKTYPDASQVQFTYTPTGKRATAVDARGTTRYAYDVRDRLTGLTYPDGQTINYTYDSTGNLLSISSLAGTIAYIYDKGRLQQVTDPAGRATGFTYDAAGNRIALTYPNGTTTSYVYDPNDRLTELRHDGPAAMLADYVYTLGPTGNRTRIDESTGAIKQYTYDALYRLIQEQVTDLAASPLWSNSFSYDAVGNRLAKTSTTGANPPVTNNYTYNVADQLVTENGVAYAFDLNGNLTSKTDAGGVTSYAYDFDNRLIRVTEPSANTTLYVYDADGNRVQKQDAAGTVRYLVDPNRELAQVLAEYSPAGLLIASYVYADDLISMTRGAQTAFYHFDGNGSTRFLTDLAGTITDTYQYDAFGTLGAHGGATVNPFLFTGQQFDANSGFYYMRARFYQPSTGRFLTLDRQAGASSDPRSLHRYVYTGNDPVNHTDPSGQFGLGGISISISINSVLSGIASLSLNVLIDYVLSKITGAEFNIFVSVGTALAFGAIGKGLSLGISAVRRSPNTIRLLQAAARRGVAEHSAWTKMARAALETAGRVEGFCPTCFTLNKGIRDLSGKVVRNGAGKYARPDYVDYANHLIMDLKPVPKAIFDAGEEVMEKYLNTTYAAQRKFYIEVYAKARGISEDAVNFAWDVYVK